MSPPLEGRTAIVTGAGDGVGRAIALRFAEAGARVLASDRDEAALEALVARIRDDGGEAAGFACNPAASLAAPNLIAAALDAFDRVDLLVNGARRLDPGDGIDTDPARLSEALELNVRAAFQVTQAAARRMIAQKRESGTEGEAGAVVNITSVAARRSVPELLHHAVACAALDQLTRSMALALAPQGVRVNAVALGAVMTTSLREALRNRSDLRRQLTRVTPLGRIGEAEEAAEAALFLASPAAGFVTGQILAVDGGRDLLDPLGAVEG